MVRLGYVSVALPLIIYFEKQTMVSRLEICRPCPFSITLYISTIFFQFTQLMLGERYVSREKRTVAFFFYHQ